MFRRFWAVPSIHQTWDERQEERKVGWSEAFFDLLYVVASMNIAHHIHATLSLADIGKAFLYFSVFWQVWWQHVLGQTRYNTNCLTFDAMNLLYFLGTLGMVFNCRDASLYPVFGMSVCLVKTSHVIATALVGFSIPDAKVLSLWTCAGSAIGAAAFAAGAFLDEPTFLTLAGLTVLWDGIRDVLAYMLLPRRALVPLHVDHLSERVGLITMIFLGESVVSMGQAVLTTDYKEHAATALSAVVVWALHLAYYNVHPGQDHHASRISIWRGYAWSLCHWILGAGMLGTGAGLRLIMGLYEGQPSPELQPVMVPQGPAWMLCGSYTLCLLMVATIRATHYLNLPGRGVRWNEVTLELGLVGVCQAWWTHVAVWPVLALGLAKAHESLGPLELLGGLAAHSVGYILIETGFTSYLSSRDEWVERLSAAMGGEPAHASRGDLSADTNNSQEALYLPLLPNQ